MMIYVVNQKTKNCLIDITTVDSLKAFQSSSEAKSFITTQQDFLTEEKDYKPSGGGTYTRYNRYGEKQSIVEFQIERVCLVMYK